MLIAKYYSQSTKNNLLQVNCIFKEGYFLSLTIKIHVIVLVLYNANDKVILLFYLTTNTCFVDVFLEANSTSWVIIK